MPIGNPLPRLRSSPGSDQPPTAPIGLGSYTLGPCSAPAHPASLPEPVEWGYSLANVRELLLGCLHAAGARSVLEVGAFRGELTEVLLEWAASTGGAEVTAIDTVPPEDLRRLADEHPELELLEQTSHEVLAGLQPLPDAIVLDGDHNHFTLSEELRLISATAGSGPLPLLLFHDVYWPHARRDTYYEPNRIPAAARQPLAHRTGLAPGNPGVEPLGLPFEWAAEREGGERNGTLTAIEDFLASEGDRDLSFARVPAFFGFGVLWDEAASWAADLAELIGPYDQHPVFERLETNRVSHLVAAQAAVRELEHYKRRAVVAERMLRRLLGASAFAWGEQLSRLRHRGKPAFSREEIRQLLEPRD